MKKVFRQTSFVFIVLSLMVVWREMPTTAQASASEIVLYASTASTKIGNFTNVSDSTAAGGACLKNADFGAPKLTTALASPAHYFEMSFNAQSGVAYRLWVRSKAENNSPYNDSYFVQFSGSVNASGQSVYRIGTTD
ncbi:MAG: hypothetical protein AB1757_10895, partial [Acidobacteriota bacterium]